MFESKLRIIVILEVADLIPLHLDARVVAIQVKSTSMDSLLSCATLLNPQDDNENRDSVSLGIATRASTWSTTMDFLLSCVALESTIGLCENSADQIQVGIMIELVLLLIPAHGSAIF